MEKYKLSVVTTTYNQEKYIEQCIRGIVNQKTDFDFQLIISDDGSTDNTRKIIEEYQKKYPKIIKPIFRDKNLGPMDNFVMTLNEAHTEYVALCDGDDYWTDNNKLQEQVDFLDKNKDYTICFHVTKIIFEDNSEKPQNYPFNIPTEQTFSDLLQGNNIPANTVVYRWLFKNNDSFKNAFPENIIPGDYYVHLMHGQKGKIHFIDKQMSVYRRQKEGMWYETSHPSLKHKFYEKNGLKYIRFYEEAEKRLDIDNDSFDSAKDAIMIETLDTAFSTNNKDLLESFIKLYYNDYRYIFKQYGFELGLFRKIKFNNVINNLIKKLK